MKFKEYLKENSQQFLTDHDEIKTWLDKMHIKDYSIDNDGTVNVELFDLDNIHNDKKITNLPVKFGKVNKYFDVSNNLLTSLDGFPNWIGNQLSFNDNKIESLEGISDIVKYVEHIYFSPMNINFGGIGFLLIDGLKNLHIVDPDNFSHGWVDIIQSYIGKDDIYGCQTELLANNFEAYAQI